MTDTVPSRSSSPRVSAPGITKVVEAISAEVTLVDSEARVITSTAGSRAALGYDETFWRSANLFDIAHPDDVGRAQQVLSEILASPGATGEERFRARHANGHWEIIEVSGKNLLADPEVGALVLTSRSVTEEEQLREAAHEAVRHASLQAEYVANVSHELRSPIQGILGVAQLLEGHLAGEPADLVAIIQREAERLRRVIDDILDHAKVNQGAMAIEPRATELRPILDAVADIVRPQLAPAVQLVIDVDPGLDQWVLVDDLRLHQVLLNLATNAARFTTDGSITVRCERASRHELRIAVIDTGTGIEHDQIESLFEPFRQGVPSEQHPGTGLGLTISKQLIELMGGRLSVESTPGSGSTFSLAIIAPPATQPSTVRRASVGAVVDGRGRALVVDDAAVNRLVIGHQLETMGFEVDEAAGGIEGVELATDGRYQLIVIDWHMPEVDGLEATRRIRDHERSGGRHTPMIAMTASAMPGDRERCLAAGVDGFLAKPATRSELAEAVSAVSTALAHELSTDVNAAVVHRDQRDEDRQPGIDREALGALVAELGDATVATVVDTYLRDLEARGAAISAAAAAGRTDVARREAHTLKSPSRMLGAVELGRLCHRIEIGDVEVDSATLDDLDRCLGAARAGLRQWLDRVERSGT